MVDRVAQRLDPMLAREYSSLPKNERRAAMDAVVDVFRTADLSDEAFFAADADPVALAASLRASVPHLPKAAGLGEPASQLYERLLEECCDCYVRIVLQLPAFGQRADAEQLSRLTDLAAQVRVALDRMPVRAMRAPRGTDHDEEFGRRYLSFVIDTLNRLELFGVSTDNYRPSTTLSVAYLSLSVTQKRDRRAAHGGERMWFADREAEIAEPVEAVVRVEQALGQSHRTLLRGEAGSGKTTLLQWLAVTAAMGGFTGPLKEWNGCTPFLVKLRQYAGQPLPRPGQFLDVSAGPIRSYLPEAWVERRMEDGQALLLVDGVDELEGRQRRAVRDWLRKLLAAFPRMKVVVTSRPAAADGDWLATEGFVDAMLQRMTPGDVRAFVGQWHRAIQDAGNLPCDENDLPRYESVLLGRFDARQDLQALATNPMLCAMLCALNLDRVTHLPPDRMGLYHAALEMLLDRRDVERDIPTHRELVLDSKDKVSLLQDLAYWLSLNGRSEIGRSKALGRIGARLATLPRIHATAEDVLEHLIQRSGVIREPVIGRFDFIHRTFQEYLAAKEIAEESHIGLILDRASQEEWRETVIMTAGHARGRECAELIAGLLDRADKEPSQSRRLRLLAASCLETVARLPPEILERVDACLDDLIPPGDLGEVNSLASAGDVVLRKLPRDLSRYSEAAARASVLTAALINGPGALEVLGAHAADRRSVVQHELQKVWPSFDPVEFAHRVLANSALTESIHVHHPSLLAGARCLRGVKDLHVTLGRVDDLSVLDGLPTLTNLTIHRGRIASLAPLEAHRELRYIQLRSASAIEDLDPLTRLPRLAYLYLDLPSGAMADLRFVLRLPQLRTLDLKGVEVDDLEPLIDHPQLETLRLPRCPRLVDVGPLARLPRLRALALGPGALEGGLPRLTALLPQLRALRLQRAPWVSDLAPLAGLPLTYLGLRGAAIEDLDPLRHVSTLRQLILEDCGALTDIGPLADLDKLQALWLDRSPVPDLAPLAGMRNLQILSLVDCPRPLDLEPLRTLPNLERLHLDGNSPTPDLSPLSGKCLIIFVRAGQELRGAERLSGDVLIRRVGRPAYDDWAS